MEQEIRYITDYASVCEHCGNKDDFKILRKLKDNKLFTLSSLCINCDRPIFYVLEGFPCSVITEKATKEPENKNPQPKIDLLSKDASWSESSKNNNQIKKHGE